MSDREHAQGEQLALVGPAEAAELLKVSRAVLWERCRRRRRAYRRQLAELSCGPVWFREQIVAYAHEAEQLASARACERFAEERPKLDALLCGRRLKEAGAGG